MEENNYETGTQQQRPRRKICSNKWWVESKKTWDIALPAMLTSVSQFSIDFVCTAFSGHLGPLELAAVSEVENVIIAFAYGVMVRICPPTILLLVALLFFLCDLVYMFWGGMALEFFSDGQNPVLFCCFPTKIIQERRTIYH